MGRTLRVFPAISEISGIGGSAPSKQGIFSVFPVFCKTKKIREKFSPRRVAILTRFSCQNRRELQVFSGARDQILDARATISS
jgi:hypothetical protein